MGPWKPHTIVHIRYNVLCRKVFAKLRKPTKREELRFAPPMAWRAFENREAVRDGSHGGKLPLRGCHHLSIG